jgi:hypothetical protein
MQRAMLCWARARCRVAFLEGAAASPRAVARHAACVLRRLLVAAARGLRQHTGVSIGLLRGRPQRRAGRDRAANRHGDHGDRRMPCSIRRVQRERPLMAYMPASSPGFSRVPLEQVARPRRALAAPLAPWLPAWHLAHKPARVSSSAPAGSRSNSRITAARGGLRRLWAGRSLRLAANSSAQVLCTWRFPEQKGQLAGLFGDGCIFLPAGSLQSLPA